MPAKRTEPLPNLWERLFVSTLGIWLGLGLLKFGNPVILADKIDRPLDTLQFLIQAWPLSWGYGALLAVTVLGIKVWRWRPHTPVWTIALPLGWLLWQFVAATQTVDAAVTCLTLIHYSSCVACFFLGLFALSNVERLAPLWLPLSGSFLTVLAVGFYQHCGGLEETRRFFYAYELPKLTRPPSPELLQKLASDRIYSTLFYPNTLAGAIILILPMTAGWFWEAKRLTKPARMALFGLAGLASVACLVWSGSKAGWLIALGMGMVYFFRLPVRKQIKAWTAATVLAAGLVSFALKYSSYFEQGATSASARLDYWRAGLKIIAQRPLFGTGPGTFAVSYKQLKTPGSEMARLAHNDYLQQGSDSGIVGLLTFSAFISVSLVSLYGRLRPDQWLGFGVWLGLSGLAGQSLVEFGLFVPALAWPQFLFLGWLLGRHRNQIDNATGGK